MSMAVGDRDENEPMMDMNTTPLIDVMLVLLIMFIITIPVATHAVNIDLPAPSENPPPVTVDPIKNKIVLTREGNQVLWNGKQITANELVTLLKQSVAMDPEPELQFEPEPDSSYELAARVLNIIKASGVTRFGFVGNERYAVFGKAPNAAAQ